MIFGAVSAVFGVLQASVATDLKRLLAYSTTENMGLVTLALGAATLLSSYGAQDVAALAMTAALLIILSHAAFKTLAFLAAGSVLAATGLRDLDKLGGLARRMPGTTVMFGIAALGASGLPLGAGFVGEWLLLRASSTHLTRARPAHADDAPVGWARSRSPPGWGSRRWSRGVRGRFLAQATLARPRSRPGGSRQHDGRDEPAAAACMVFAVAPVLLGPLLGRVLAALPTVGGGEAGPVLGNLTCACRASPGRCPPG